MWLNVLCCHRRGPRWLAESWQGVESADAHPRGSAQPAQRECWQRPKHFSCTIRSIPPSFLLSLFYFHFPSYVASPSRLLAPPSFPPNIVFTGALTSLTPVARGHWMETHQGRESRRRRRRRWRRRRRRGVGRWTEEEGGGKAAVTEGEERYGVGSW